MIAKYKDEGEATPNIEQWIGSLLLSAMLCLVWPLALVFARWPVKVGAEREAGLKKREQRVKELERELGL